jgi:hypothetical protein
MRKHSPTSCWIPNILLGQNALVTLLSEGSIGGAGSQFGEANSDGNSKCAPESRTCANHGSRSHKDVDVSP